MTDTIRTKSELLSKINDNSTEDISPQDLRDWLLSFRVFGEIGVIGNTQAINPLGSGFNVVPLNQAGPNECIVVDTANYLLQVPVAGRYRIEYAFTWSGTANVLYEFAVLKNGSTINRTQRQDTVSSAQERRNISGSATVDFIATDEIKLAVSSEGNSFTLRYGGLRIERLD